MYLVVCMYTFKYGDVSCHTEMQDPPHRNLSFMLRKKQIGYTA